MTKKIGIYRCKNGNGAQWQVRWFGRYDPNTGKSKRYSKTFALKKDADRFRKHKEDELSQGGPRDLSTETLKQYAEQWLQYKVGFEKIRPATVQLYRQTLDRLCDYFGPDLPLRKIDKQAAMGFLASLQPLTDRTDSLASWTAHRVLRHCKTLFKGAVGRVIVQNPFAELKGPKCVTSEWYHLQSDEYRKMLDVTPTLQEKALYALCYTAALRLNEALNLLWSDIDFNKGQVRLVNRPATDKLPPFYLKDTDCRTVPLPEQTLDLLQLLRAAPDKLPFALLTKERFRIICNKWQKYQQAGRKWRGSDMANNVQRNFHQRVRMAGIDAGGKKLSIHTLRKCCGKNWADSISNPEVVRVLMGHSSLNTTMRFYNQVSEDDRKKAARATENYLNSTALKSTDAKLTFSAELNSKKEAV